MGSFVIFTWRIHEKFRIIVSFINLNFSQTPYTLVGMFLFASKSTNLNIKEDSLTHMNEKLKDRLCKLQALLFRLHLCFSVLFSPLYSSMCWLYSQPGFLPHCQGKPGASCFLTYIHKGRKNDSPCNDQKRVQRFSLIGSPGPISAQCVCHVLIGLSLVCEPIIRKGNEVIQTDLNQSPLESMGESNHMLFHNGVWVGWMSSDDLPWLYTLG